MKDWEIWDEAEVAKIEEAWGSPIAGKGRHQRLVEKVASLISDMSVLDVGCGLGHLYYLIRNEVQAYLGVDSSHAMIEKARSYFGKSLFVVGDAYDLSSIPSADTVVCLDVVKHVPETWPVLKELWGKARKQVILVTNVGLKQHTRKTPQKGGKYLIYRVETVKNVMSLFEKLPDIGKIEQVPFDGVKGTVIFRVHKNV